MNEITVSRLGCIVLSLFPALWGLVSLWNNAADFAGTARSAVGPLLAMQAQSAPIARHINPGV